MITAIILLCLLAIKDEIVALIGLYSTLQGNLIVYYVNSVITISSILFETRFISVYEGTWREYSYIVISVSLIAPLIGALVIKNKKWLQNIIRKKRISKTQTIKWAERKTKQTEVTNGQVKQEIVGEPKDVLPGPTENNT